MLIRETEYRMHKNSLYYLCKRFVNLQLLENISSLEKNLPTKPPDVPHAQWTNELNTIGKNSIDKTKSVTHSSAARPRWTWSSPKESPLFTTTMGASSAFSHANQTSNGSVCSFTRPLNSGLCFMNCGQIPKPNWSRRHCFKKEAHTVAPDGLKLAAILQSQPKRWDTGVSHHFSIIVQAVP